MDILSGGSDTEQMEDCLRNGSSKYASKEILAYLSRINAVRKNRELFERQFALTAGQEAEGTEELIRRFRKRVMESRIMIC